MKKADQVNLFPGMLSPADLRHLKEIFSDFGLPFLMLPDYSRTLDGSPWKEYHKIPDGGTPVQRYPGNGEWQRPALSSEEFYPSKTVQENTSGKI